MEFWTIMLATVHCVALWRCLYYHGMRQDRQSTGVFLIVWKIVSFLFPQVIGVSGPMVHKYMWMLACVSAIASVFPATVESSAHQLNPTEAFCADVFSSYVFSSGLLQNIWMLVWYYDVLCIWVFHRFSKSPWFCICFVPFATHQSALLQVTGSRWLQMKPAAPTQQCAVKPLIANLLGSGLNGPLESLGPAESLRLVTTAHNIRQTL